MASTSPVTPQATGPSFLWFLASFAALVAIQAAASRSEQLAVGFMLLFGLLVGLGSASTIGYYAHSDLQVAWESGVATALFIAGFGAVGYATRRDLSGLARALLWALVGLIAFGYVLVLVQIPGGALIYSVAGLVIFAGITLLDFQRLRRIDDVRTACNAEPAAASDGRLACRRRTALRHILVTSSIGGQLSSLSGGPVVGLAGVSRQPRTRSGAWRRSRCPVEAAVRRTTGLPKSC